MTDTYLATIPALPNYEVQGNAETSSTVSINHELSPSQEENNSAVVQPETLPTTPVSTKDAGGVSTDTDSDGAAVIAALGTLRVTNANSRSDKGGTVNLGQLEPFCGGARELPMYEVFDATVRFPNQNETKHIVGYVNRLRSTSYWGSRSIPNGNKCRVIWEEQKLGHPLPGKGEAITLEVLAFARRNAVSNEATA